MGANTKGAVLSLFAYAIYSGHDVIIKHLGATYSPFQILFFSVLFGFPLVTLMLVKDRALENLRPRHPWWIALRTLSILLGGAFGFYAFSALPLAQTYAMLFTMPLQLTLLSIPLLGERVGLHRGGAVVVGLIGVIIVLRPGTTDLSLGHLAALGAAFFSSLASIVVRRIGKQERDIVLLLFPMLGSFLILAVLLPYNYLPMPLVDLGAVALLALLAILAMVIIINAYKSAEAVVVAPMQYSQMLWAVFYGAVLFNEFPDLQTLAGATVIIISGLYIVIRESRRNISENTPVLLARNREATGSFFRLGGLLNKSHRDTEK